MDCKCKSSQLLKEVSIVESAVHEKVGPHFIHVNNLIWNIFGKVNIYKEKEENQFLIPYIFLSVARFALQHQMCMCSKWTPTADRQDT
jgi:hypothetical protein